MMNAVEHTMTEYWLEVDYCRILTVPSRRKLVQCKEDTYAKRYA